MSDDAEYERLWSLAPAHLRVMVDRRRADEIAAARREGIEAAAALADDEWCCECPQTLDIGEVCCGSPLRVCDTALPSRIRALLKEGEG